MKTIGEAAKKYANGIFTDEFKSENRIREESFAHGMYAAQRWIPVEEELPICDRDLTLFTTKVSSPVIVKYDNGQYEIAVLSEGNWYNSQGQRIYKPTHWRPIEYK